MSHVSHSQLTSWLRCGKAYELSRLKHAPRVPAVWTASGVALHEVIDLINKASISGDSLDVKATWTQVYGDTLERVESETGVPREHWKRAGRVSKDKPNKEDAVWWGIDGYRQLLAYQAWLHTSGYRPYVHDGVVLSEFETSTAFGNVQVKGFLDAVMQAPDGTLIVMDAKSGTRVPSSVTQLGLYATALRMTLGLDITQGAFMMTRKGELTDWYDLSKYTEQFFTPLFTGLKKAIDMEVFLPNPGDACFTCDVATSCYANGGVDAWRFDNLHPSYGNM